jgi:hypothetical protein
LVILCHSLFLEDHQPRGVHPSPQSGRSGRLRGRIPTPRRFTAIARRRGRAAEVARGTE